MVEASQQQAFSYDVSFELKKNFSPTELTGSVYKIY